MRYVLTDDLWTALEPMVQQAKRHECGRKPAVPDRDFFEALLYLARTGLPWRDLPSDFGAWDAVYNQPVPPVGPVRRPARLVRGPDRGPAVRGRAAGVHRLDHRPRPPARRRGPAEAEKIGAERSARAQSLGRSRGGLSTKIMAVAADEDTLVAVDVVPGQAGDAPPLVPMPDRTLERVEVDEIVGDNGFDGDHLRCDGLNREVNPNIPLKKNRDPEAWAFDADSDKERNRVERLVGKAKQFRRIATRYEKLKAAYLGLLHLVLGFIRLRKQRNVNTP